MSSDTLSEPKNAPLYLYLTTIGRKTGNPHEIEIWFVEYGGRYYLMSEFPEEADWVKNIQNDSAVSFRIGSRSAEAVAGTGRICRRRRSPDARKIQLERRADCGTGKKVRGKSGRFKVKS